MLTDDILYICIMNKNSSFIIKIRIAERTWSYYSTTELGSKAQ